MNLKESLVASIVMDDARVEAYRAMMKRQRPDLSNKDDIDVCGWLQSMETYAREFHAEYAEAKSHHAYDQLAPDLVYHLKCAIITIQDMRERAGILD